MPLGMDQSDIACLALCSKLLSMLAHIAVDRGDLEVALDFTHRAVNKAREDPAATTVKLFSPVIPEGVPELLIHLGFKALILEWLGRLDEALALDEEYLALNERKGNVDILTRRAKKCIAAGQDAQAEHFLRVALAHQPGGLMQEYSRITRKWNEAAFRPHALLAELLERRGTEEALAEARSFRDKIAQHLAKHEARRAAALEETRVAAAEAMRQWREERSKARGEKKGVGKGKKKSKKKGKEEGEKGQGVVVCCGD
jgi:tetratricopeptide (TPR) repeat protein